MVDTLWLMSYYCIVFKIVKGYLIGYKLNIGIHNEHGCTTCNEQDSSSKGIFQYPFPEFLLSNAPNIIFDVQRHAQTMPTEVYLYQLPLGYPQL
jgi:hypothetical protein